MCREGRRGLFCIVLSMLLLSITVPFAHAQSALRSLPSFDARTVDFARQGAMQRLRAHECQQILGDFTDAQGRTLIESLARFDMSPDQYLAQLPFLDGNDHRLCEAGRSQLLTSQGVSRVFVCKAFLDTVRLRRAQAEVYVIHEMLHTLGLGENPPTSQEITQRVIRRCAS